MRQKFIVTMLSGKIYEVYADDYTINPNVPEVLLFLQESPEVVDGKRNQVAASMFNLKNVESIITVDETGRPLHDRKVAVMTSVSNLIMNS